MLQQQIKKAREEDGFTLIELLVVILIIGILAAIALPTFLGQSDKAKDSSAKSNARNAVTQMESCLADASAPSTAVTTCAANDDVKGTGDSAVTVTATSGAGYRIAAKSATDTYFTITKAGTSPGAYTRVCGATATPTASNADDGRQGKGGCPTNGLW